MKGNLILGTLKNDTYLRPVGWSNNISGNIDAGFIKIKGNTQLKFSNGEITSGILADQTKLNTINGTKIFPANTLVQFDDKGYAI